MCCSLPYDIMQWDILHSKSAEKPTMLEAQPTEKIQWEQNVGIAVVTRTKNKYFHSGYRLPRLEKHSVEPATNEQSD